MKKTVIEQYNGLNNKTVSRKYLEKLLSRAKRANEKRVVLKLETLLSKNDDNQFFVTIKNNLQKVPVRKISVKRRKRALVKRSVKSKHKTTNKKARKVNVVGLGFPKVYLNNPKQDIEHTIPENPNIPIQNPIIHSKPNAVSGISKSFSSKKANISQAVIPKVRKPMKGRSTMADLDNEHEPIETFKLDTPIGKFLGDLEKKPIHSLVVTLDAPAGSGKTRFFFQVMEDYASVDKKCAFITLEEHSISQVFKKKRNQYINPTNYERITVVDDIKDYEEFKSIVESHDIILVDSFGKLQRLIKRFKIELDEHIRKAFDGKLFFLIFQRTTGKTMRGGSDSEFDGDVILQVEKPSEDYQENFVIARKNRYNEIPNLKYSIFQRNIIEGNQEQPSQNIKNSVKPTDSSAKLVVSSF